MTSASEAAARERINFGIGELDPVPDLVSLIEGEREIPIFSLPLGERVMDGMYVCLPDENVIVVNSTVHHLRRRFTLAHEFGHHVLGHGEQVDQDISFDDTTSVEREANEFAGRFLLPDEAVLAWRPPEGAAAAGAGVRWDLENVARLASAFAVSCSVALIRLKSCGEVSDPVHVEGLERQIKGGQHRRHIRSKKLDTTDDTLTRTTGHVRLPASTYARAAELVASGLLAQQTLDAWAEEGEFDGGLIRSKGQAG